MKRDIEEIEEEIEKKIMAALKWQKFDNYELKITNRIAHCNICRHEIQKDEQRAIVNPHVVSRRYLTCLKCLELLKIKIYEKLTAFSLDHGISYNHTDKISIIDQKLLNTEIMNKK